MKRISIKERLILYFVLLGLVSIAIVSSFSIFESKKGIRERAFNQLILLRDLRREQILAFYNSKGRELMALASSKMISECISQFKTKTIQKSGMVFLREESSLIELVTDPGTTGSLHLVTPDMTSYILEKKSNGIELRPDPNFFINKNTSSLFNKQNNRSSYLVKEQIDDKKGFQILIQAPVFSGTGEAKAMLVSELNPEVLQSLIYINTPGTGLGKTGEAYLVGQDGFMRTPSRFLDDVVMKVRVETEGFRDALKGRDGTGIYDDYRGIKILGAYGMITVGELQQVILAEIDVSEAMIPLKSIRNDILLVSSLILLLIFLVTWFVAHGITRPLIRLKNAANTISTGTYPQNLEIESDDEIGELTGAFNTMSEALASERIHRIRAVFDGKDTEQQRLSRELHDGLGQQLVAGKMMLESSLYEEGTKLKSRIIEAQAVFDQIISEIRRISHDLSPSILTEFGLKAAIENLCRSINKATGITIDMSYELPGLQPDGLISTYLYRITQESMNNIQLHSGAKHVGISLMQDQGWLILEIGDDGKGFDTSKVQDKGGTGLCNMKERVNILGGDLKIRSAPGEGTKIRIRVPYPVE